MAIRYFPIFLSICLFSLFITTSHAAEITNKEKDDNKSLVTISGVIEQGDYGRFNSAIKKAKSKNIYVVLRSRGGHFDTGVKIAKRIVDLNKRKLEINTSAIYCQSACFFIAAAGKQKYVLYSKHVFGVHFPYHKDKSKISLQEHKLLDKKQISSLMHSGFSKKQARDLVKKAMVGTPNTTITFSRKELVNLGFLLL